MVVVAAKGADAGMGTVMRVSESAARVATGGLYLGAGVWNGVELTDVRITKRSAHYVIDDISVFASWLRSQRRLKMPGAQMTRKPTG